MKAFHELVYNGWIQDVGFVLHAGALPWAFLLGAVDRLKFVVITDSVGGVSPTFNMILVETPTLLAESWNIVDSPILDAPIATDANTVLTASWAPAEPITHALTQLIWINGTNPSAHVRIWVTGRLN